jgi:hypothetical protein
LITIVFANISTNPGMFREIALVENLDMFHSLYCKDN